MLYFRPASLIFAGSLVLLAATAHAQSAVSIGPRVGLNLATYHSAENGTARTTEYRAGFEAGIAGTVGFGHMGLQAAVLYSQKGSTSRATVDIRTANNTPVVTAKLKGSSRLNYLTIPLALAYTQHRDGQGAQVFAGPYLGVLLGGRYDNTTTPPGGAATTSSGPIKPINDEAPDLEAYARRFDAGLQAGLGYRYQALLLQATYSLGLRNVSASYTYNGVPVRTSPYYNRAFQVSLTYLLGPKS